MAELSDMISDLLSDPSTADRLQALINGYKSKSKPEKDGTAALPIPDSDDVPADNGDGPTNENTGSSVGGAELLKSIDPSVMLRMTRAMSAMSSNQADNRTRLLYDLKPYISDRRARRLDEAAQLLRMLNVIDILKDGLEKDGENR